MLKARINTRTWLIIFTVFLFLICFRFNFFIKSEQQYSFLSQSFLRGRLYFIEKPATWVDAVEYNGKYFWPPGPFPAVFLMPFVAAFNFFGTFFYQGYLQFFLVVGIFYIIYKLALHYCYNQTDAIFLAFTFCFASAFLGVAFVPWSGQLSQVITVFLFFGVFYEYITKRRYWLIGVIMGCIGATRPVSSLALIFFVLEILFRSKTLFKQKLRLLVELTIFPAVVFLLLLGYNMVRFGDPFEQGYNERQVAPSFHRVARDTHGMFSLKHVPRNLYYMFINIPKPVFLDESRVLKFPFVSTDQWGMSIFITSPYLLYLFTLRFKDRCSRHIIITVVLILIPILLFYSSGGRQFGYRYVLEFSPLLHWLFIRKYKVTHDYLSSGFKALVLFSAYVNLYLFLTISWNWDPLQNFIN